jgi:hypothetical protein
MKRLGEGASAPETGYGFGNRSRSQVEHGHIGSRHKLEWSIGNQYIDPGVFLMQHRTRRAGARQNGFVVPLQQERPEEGAHILILYDEDPCSRSTLRGRGYLQWARQTPIMGHTAIWHKPLKGV